VTLRHIAEALHPNHITLHVILESRSEILNQTLHQLRPQYSNVGLNSRRLELYPLVLHVAKALMYPSENRNRKIFSMVHHISLTYQFFIHIIEELTHARGGSCTKEHFVVVNSSVAPGNSSEVYLFYKFRWFLCSDFSVHLIVSRTCCTLSYFCQFLVDTT